MCIIQHITRVIFAFFIMRSKILLGLTTTKNSNWRDKIKEIDELGLTEIALFLTCLKIGQRKKLYKLLEKTKLKRIPFVHLRDDFKAWEFDYLIEKYKTEVFNTHFDRVNERVIAESKKHLEKIYLENHGNTPDSRAYLLDIFAGLCLDISHWEDYGELQKMPNYKKMPKLLKKYKVGCCHISAITTKPTFNEDDKSLNYASHYLHDLSELDYVKKYVKYLSPVCAIELENSFKQQLEAKKYIEKIIK